MKSSLSLRAVVLLCVLFYTGCTQIAMLPPGEHPIETINPPISTPTALAWSGNKTISMALDTGAAQEALLFSPSASKLGARVRGRGMMRYSNVDISLAKDASPISTKPDVVMVSDAPYDGIIGWKTIRQYVWNLNYPKGSHLFYDSLPKRVKRWDRLQLSPDADFAQIKNKQNQRIIIDTGAPHAIYIAKKDWERFKLDYPDAPVSIYSGFSPAAGGYYALECIRIRSYTIGNLELRNIVVCESFADKTVMGLTYDIDVIMGMGAFFGREFWLDGPGNTLYFSSRRPTAVAFPTFNSVGATFIPGKNGELPYTAKVTDWSIAWQCGLRNDDILVSLNGRKHPDIALIEYVTTQPGTRAEVTVRRKNKLIEIAWEVPETPEPGEYHPTPKALTDEEFEQYQAQQEQDTPTSEDHPRTPLIETPQS